MPGGAFDGIPLVVDGLDKMASAGKRAEAAAKGAAAAAKLVGDAFHGAASGVADMEKRMTEAVPGFVSLLNTILDIDKAIADGYQQRSQYSEATGGAGDEKYTKEVENEMKNLIAQLKKAGGKDSFMAAYATNILTELEGRIISPGEALKVLQGFFRAYESGFIKDISGGATQQLRLLAAAIEAFISGGQLNGFR